MQKVIVVIPTLNEEQAIEQRIRTLFSQVVVSAVIVVDDHSQDKTQEIVRKLQQEFSSLFLLGRIHARNFSQSYREGFDYALKSGADIIVQMDADGSHDERYLADMIRKLDSHDFVIGSRYAPGGGIRQWNTARRLLSRFGNYYARAITRIPYADATGGYNAWKRQVLENIDFSQLSNKGYVFQVWLKWNAHKKKFVGYEHPIVFVERQKGKSKFHFWMIVESLVEILKLRIYDR